ncbi:hypothetical protein ASPWEDRAFT_42624 [Aspergillus wentii DTO 134E9]|uniref:F-box domain-containing protein n=1 Tax=Aspergillus wentii DTO 134E9 TaxID=1073089 RepID=A0A1L9RCG1_ASPWE|nr:uncharacterized protein ASPWEDRAFT_42624 [Aspergillus wentii DTO 134E9]OJJ32606.1 hypothetical protein ASPWEDRAFT_42624 [Aspergillus wentii DTO 134E9]
MQLPVEIIDLITSFVEHPLEDDRYTLCPVDKYNPNSVHDLSSLRLVNAIFSYCATPRLFRIVHATYSAHDSEKGCRPLSRLRGISRSYCAPFVRHVEVGLDGPWKSTPGYEAYIQSLQVLLPDCLGRLPNLAVLNFHGPSYSHSHADPLFSWEKISCLTNRAVQTLGDTPLPKLRDLTLALPLTASFRSFLAVPDREQEAIHNVLKQLEHLRVEICDNTGSGGKRYMRTPLSEAKSVLPNREHASHLFNCIELAGSLTSLEIRSTDVLDLDTLSLSNQDHLQILSLCNVSISSDCLISLLGQCTDTISRIAFNRVELKSGTWQDILCRISQLPSLQYFSIVSSGYSKTGESCDLSLGFSLMMDASRDIETCNPLDYNALGDVQRRVNRNRAAGGLAAMGPCEYRRTEMRSLEDALKRKYT